MGVTDSFKFGDKKQSIKLMDYQVIPASKDLQQDLFLEDNDFVYKVKRLRLIDDQPFIIETGYIPIKIIPTLSPDIVKSSIFNYLETAKGKRVTKCRLVLPHQRQMTSDCLN